MVTAVATPGCPQFQKHFFFPLGPCCPLYPPPHQVCRSHRSQCWGAGGRGALLGATPQTTPFSQDRPANPQASDGYDSIRKVPPS